MTSKPLILAIETSGRTGSIAVAKGGQMLAETAFSAQMRHSAKIFPAACDLLGRFGRKPKEIRHIYISVGPGSFTGLRIAATFAKTMYLTNSAKIVAIDTLDAIAANVTSIATEENIKNLGHKSRIATILDAKRGQFFISAYECLPDSGAWKKILPDSLLTANEFLDEFACKERPIWLLGEGLVYYKNKFKAAGTDFLDESYWNPRASKIHLLGWEMALAGQFADPLVLKPTYLRRPEAEEKWDQRKTKR